MPKRPTEQPPSEAATSGKNAAGQSRPEELSAEQLAAATNVSTTSTAPSLMPPAAAAGAASVTAWQSDKRITALWGISENRNSWVHVDGIGWKKLVASSDSASVALTQLAAHAKQGNRPVNYREEADGMIYEMYIW